MTSFTAALQVAGRQFPVHYCTFGTQQATSQRGRASTQVRYEPVQLGLDVPFDDVLLGWVADPHRQQEAHLVFTDADGGSPLEILRLPAAYCVAYAEEFWQGDDSEGSYRCRLTLVDPTGWSIQAGERAASANPAAPGPEPAAGIAAG